MAHFKFEEKKNSALRKWEGWREGMNMQLPWKLNVILL